MEKCRICLKYSKNTRSIYATDDGITFFTMMTAIANIKIHSEDKVTEICLSCRKKLRITYDFKLIIERSDMVLQESANFKRISFSDISDIKIKIEIDSKPVLNIPDKLLFEHGKESISYNNTIIKKIHKEQEDDEQKKSLSVVEFLNSIKAESDNDLNDDDYDIGIDDYGLESDSDVYKPHIERKKNKSKQNKSKGSTKNKNSQHNRRSWCDYQKVKPIKPVILNDVRVTRTEVKIVRKKGPPKKYVKKSVVCPYCGKLTPSLNSHILVHSEKPFKCDQCTRAFLTEEHLNKHKTVHSAPKNYKCDQCVAAFVCKSSLTSHMLMHSDEKNFICNICNKAFKRKPILVRHLLTHNFGKKPIQCELCPMSFNTKYGLRHHLRIHTGERPFRCDICSQPYSYKHDFNRHCLKKHGVFLKRRAVYIMNEEVLQQERALMKDLALRAHGIIKEGEFTNPFDGPQAALAYELAMKALEARQIPINF